MSAPKGLSRRSELCSRTARARTIASRARSYKSAFVNEFACAGGVQLDCWVGQYTWRVSTV
ncbi:hypothetical protein D3C78_1899010 [compost metagenome]